MFTVSPGPPLSSLSPYLLDSTLAPATTVASTASLVSAAQSSGIWQAACVTVKVAISIDSLLGQRLDSLSLPFGTLFTSRCVIFCWCWSSTAPALCGGDDWPAFGLGLHLRRQCGFAFLEAPPVAPFLG